MKKRGNPEFFEVFRRPDENEKESSTESLRPKKALSMRPSASSGRIVLAMKYETAVLVAFAVVAVLVASHVFVYYRGKSNRKAIAPERNVVDTTEDRIPTPTKSDSTVSTTRMQAPFWSLRVMTAPLSNVRRVRDDLSARGHDAFICRPSGGQDYTVHVGRFATKAEAEMSNLQQTFKAMQYYGQKPFTSCYYVQITDEGRIIP